MAGAMMRLIDMIYPPQCAGCAELTTAAHGLCATCWRDTTFISGAVCDLCGVPVPLSGGAPRVVCEGCAHAPPGWDRGRAAVLYEGTGRRVVLALKHGDRLDLARPLARWLVRAGADVLDGAQVLAPVPLHPLRFLRRRYNQSAELSRGLSRLTAIPHIPDLLTRTRATRAQEGMTRETRFATQLDAFRLAPRHADAVAGRTVLLIDDVMTSGATLTNCAAALRAAGPARIDVLVLARVAREGRTPI